ncbi:MAG TPA: hypothetical protein VNW97_08550 [Candidatus Saccharimonadales bacterium]|jgi:hypothetical protein|nr:hypothetical protein [Candidatus Saccharimonadales bacterium]
MLDSIRPDTSFGCCKLRIYRSPELESAQNGYSIGTNGESLTGDEDGDWSRNWVVIGYDDTSGDPLFIDTSEEGYPVYTAMIGQGRWDRQRIAVSLTGFSHALSAIAAVAEGREHPVTLEQNPLTQSEGDNVLASIRQQNPNMDVRFWETLLSS